MNIKIGSYVRIIDSYCKEYTQVGVVTKIDGVLVYVSFREGYFADSVFHIIRDVEPE